MNVFKNQLLFVLVLLFSIGCSNNEHKNKNQEDNLAADDASGVIMLYKEGITLTEVPQKHKDNISLSINNPDLSKPFSLGEINLTFITHNFEVGKDGFINISLNNALVKSYETNSVKRKMPEGEFIFSAFLADKNQLSIKTKSSFILQPIKVGKGPKENLGFIADSSHLIYNKPQGVYKGAEANKILLDFFLVNTELSENGKRVRALINGVEFILPKWATYSIEGLPMGKSVIRIDLVNDLGVLPGPFNRGEERVITLEPST